MIAVRKGTWARRVLLALAGILAVGATLGAILARSWPAHKGVQAKTRTMAPPPVAVAPPPDTKAPPQLVRLTTAQQKAIGLRTATVQDEPIVDVLEAPGRVIPDEAHYAYITPRAAGVIRSVTTQIGQDVQKGQLLAVLDSSEVAQARLDLVGRSQELSLARAQDQWQESIYQSTNELIERLKAGDSPEDIHRRFENRPIGETREKLITAYASYRLAHVTFQRNKELQQKNAISLSQFQQATAEYDSTLAVYEGLMDRMGFEATQSYRKSRQERRKAETAVRVAEEYLRVLGVTADDPELRAVELKAKEGPKPPATLSEALKGDGFQGDGPCGVLLTSDQPVSTYELRAPFAGTILDRGVVVPGVAVDTTHQLFTMADLSTVWIEAHVHESDFPRLAGAREGAVTIRSRAYPERPFDGKVLYTGDLVDDKSRMVKLLASAVNPERRLKPGMFVEVTIASQSEKTAPVVPESAILTDGTAKFVWVRTSPETFEHREIVAGDDQRGRVVVHQGLRAGEEVVTASAYELKAEALRLAGGASEEGGPL